MVEHYFDIVEEKVRFFLGLQKKFDLFDFLLYICVNINDCGVGVVSL
jgi:hypothetical protein